MNPTAPVLLVVTPTLGDSPFLDATVAAVAALPLSIRHVLSVPAARIEHLQARYPDTQVVADAGRSGGIYGALNAALALVPDGWDWFTYINDDDLLLPGFGEMARVHMAKPDAEPVTYGNVGLIGEDGGHLGLITVEPNPRRIPALLQQQISPVMQQGMLFKRECVQNLHGFDMRYKLCADLDFWLRAHTLGERFRFYPRLVAQFRRRAGQLSGNTALTIQEQADIVSRHLPTRLSAWRRHVAVLRYRYFNLPRYLGRFRRARGVRTSYELLEQAP